jgi:hypothetical protein
MAPLLKFPGIREDSRTGLPYLRAINEPADGGDGTSRLYLEGQRFKGVRNSRVPGYMKTRGWHDYPH